MTEQKPVLVDSGSFRVDPRRARETLLKHLADNVTALSTPRDDVKFLEAWRKVEKMNSKFAYEHVVPVMHFRYDGGKEVGYYYLTDPYTKNAVGDCPNTQFGGDLIDKFKSRYPETLTRMISLKEADEIKEGGLLGKLVSGDCPMLTGDIVCFNGKDKTLGSSIKDIFEGSEYQFMIPSKYSKLKNAALLIHHPNYSLLEDEGTLIVSPEESKIEVIENIPNVEGWYLTDDKTGFPINHEANPRSDPVARYLDMHHDFEKGKFVRSHFVGPLIRGDGISFCHGWDTGRKIYAGKNTPGDYGAFIEKRFNEKGEKKFSPMNVLRFFGIGGGK